MKTVLRMIILFSISGLFMGLEEILTNWLNNPVFTGEFSILVIVMLALLGTWFVVIHALARHWAKSKEESN